MSRKSGGSKYELDSTPGGWQKVFTLDQFSNDFSGTISKTKQSM